jgi:hypothetical protein
LVTVSVRPWPPQVPTNALTSAAEPDEDDDGAADEVDAEADEVGAAELEVGAAEVDGKSMAELGAADVLAPGLPKPVVVLLQAETAPSSTAASTKVRQRGRCGMARG